MTRDDLKQIERLTKKLDEKYQEWLGKMDTWSDMNDDLVAMPSLPHMVEDLLNHLRGLDKKLAESYDWMMIL